MRASELPEKCFVVLPGQPRGGNVAACERSTPRSASARMPIARWCPARCTGGLAVLPTRKGRRRRAARFTDRGAWRGAQQAGQPEKQGLRVGAHGASRARQPEHSRLAADNHLERGLARVSAPEIQRPSWRQRSALAHQDHAAALGAQSLGHPARARSSARTTCAGRSNRHSLIVGSRLAAVGRIRRPKGGGLRDLTLGVAQRGGQLYCRDRPVMP